MTAGGWFITSEKGLERVKVYDGDGAFKGVVAGARTFGPKPLSCEAVAGPDCRTASLDVAVDGKGRVLVLQQWSGQVRSFTAGTGAEILASV